jgi:predicted nucleic acid-binding Zn ribbon protein
VEKLSREQRRVGVRHMVTGFLLLVLLLVLLSVLSLCGLPFSF